MPLTASARDMSPIISPIRLFEELFQSYLLCFHKLCSQTKDFKEATLAFFLDADPWDAEDTLVLLMEYFETNKKIPNHVFRFWLFGTHLNKPN